MIVPWQLQKVAQAAAALKPASFGDQDAATECRGLMPVAVHCGQVLLNDSMPNIEVFV